VLKQDIAANFEHKVRSDPHDVTVEGCVMQLA